MPDVITILQNNVVTTHVAGADVLLPMAIAASAVEADRAETAADAAEEFLDQALAIQAVGDDAAAIAARVPKNTDGSDFTQPAAVRAAIGADLAANVNLAALSGGFPVQTVAAAFGEHVTIGRLVAGFDPDEGDNTTVLQTAVERAVARGIGLLVPPSLSEVSEAVVIEGALPIIGSGGRAQFRRMVAADAVFTAEDLDAGPTYHNLGFLNDPLAPEYVSDPDGVSDAYGRFLLHTRVHGVRYRDIVLDGRNGDGKAGIFAAAQNLYGDNQDIVGLWAYGILGNVIGPNGDGAGLGGKGHRYSHIYLFDGCDTGVGAWTGAEDFVLDQFVIAPATNASDANLAPYTKVCIDIAGGTDVRIGKGTCRGGTIGVRCASNDVGGGTIYANDRVVLSEDLILSGQEASTAGAPEPGQGVKVAHFKAGLSRFTDRSQHRVSGGSNYGILGTVNHASAVLAIDIDKARFEGSGASAHKFAAGGSGGGLRFRPGSAETKDFTGTVTTGNGANATVTLDDDRKNTALDFGDSFRDFATFNNTSTLNKLAVANLTAGFYRIFLLPGAMSDVAGGVTLNLPNATSPMSAANANSPLEFYVSLTVDYNAYEVSYTSTAGGNNYAFKRLTIQKLT